MREIKFRAWIELENGCANDDPAYYKEKMMVDVASLEFDEDELCEITIIDDYFRDGETVYFDINDVDLLQYTGLKDRNGTEIYEGDVMKDYDGKLLEVISGDSGFYFKGDAGWYDSFGNLADSFEVVGNKYQNPELVEGD
jgi:hypothetical protein